MDTLVSGDWLEQQLGDPGLVVLDCSVIVDMETGETSSGRAEYEAGHIPSAGFADLTGDLCDRQSSIQWALPPPEQFCAALGELGVGDDSRVVLYDGSMSFWAARVWWMLRWVGFDNAALLDGGLMAWKADGRQLSTTAAAPESRHLTPRLRSDLVADREEVLSAIDDDAVHVIDALPEAVYSGEQQPYGRPGHIPGAVNICTLDMLDESGRYRSREELAALHGGDHEDRHITYCGGGIMASANAFVMTRLGFTDVAVYTASLQEWAADPDSPMTTGTN